MEHRPAFSTLTSTLDKTHTGVTSPLTRRESFKPQRKVQSLDVTHIRHHSEDK